MGRLSFVSGQGVGVRILVPFAFWVVLGLSTSVGQSGGRWELGNVGA